MQSTAKFRTLSSMKRIYIMNIEVYNYNFEIISIWENIYTLEKYKVPLQGTAPLTVIKKEVIEEQILSDYFPAIVIKAEYLHGKEIKHIESSVTYTEVSRGITYVE